MLYEKPLISIILPIYNIEKYLSKCMESVLRQSYKNLEIIMVDDGSQDMCGQICEKYAKQDSRVVVLHKTNGGLSDARNFGIEYSRGDFITCIDPDDYVDVDYIDYLYMLLKKHKCKMSICQHRVHYDNGFIKDFGDIGEDVISAEKCLERMLYHDVIDTSAWGKLYKRDLFENVKYPKGKLFEDIGTTYALIMQCDRIAIGYESKYNYIFHNNSIVNSSFKPNKFDLMEMTDKMAKDVLKVYPNLEDAILRRRVYSRISTLNQMLNVKDFEMERKNIISFIKKNGVIVRKNPKTPKRDKVALLLLNINYKLYKFCWLSYQKIIMKKAK